MDIRKLTNELNILLNLERCIVGVKLVHSKEEYEKYSGKELILPMSYCVAVKCATLGHSIKLTRDTGGCFGSNRALGLVECNPEFKSGESGCRLGLYETPQVAASVANTVPICENNTYGVIVKPLELFEDLPDVVLIISDTREAMRILQGYTYVYGLTKGLCMSGNQAVCVEATLFPIFTKELNLSMFCSGTRYKANWKPSEVISGIPIEKLEGLVKGLIGTINPIEMNDRKKEIEKGFRALGCLDFEIDYEKTYFKTWKNKE